MLATIICSWSWLSSLSWLVDHQTDISKRISAMRIVVMEWRFAKLLCIWVNIVTVMSQALQAFVTVLTVKPHILEDCPGSVDAVQNGRFRNDFGFVTRSPDDFLNASTVACQSLVLSVMGQP